MSILVSKHYSRQVLVLAFWNSQLKIQHFYSVLKTVHHPQNIVAASAPLVGCYSKKYIFDDLWHKMFVYFVLNNTQPHTFLHGTDQLNKFSFLHIKQGRQTTVNSTVLACSFITSFWYKHFISYYRSGFFSNFHWDSNYVKWNFIFIMSHSQWASCDNFHYLLQSWSSWQVW